MTITGVFPPIVAQTLTDSCWAAALESWTRVDPQMPDRRQAALIQQWGEGPTGGITPAAKIPVIASAIGLAWGGFDANGLVPYITAPSAQSHLLRVHARGLHPRRDDLPDRRPREHLVHGPRWLA